MLKLPEKAPAEKLDYEMDFSDVLGTDTITGTPTVTGAGITVASTPPISHADGIVTFWLSGGAEGSDGTVTVTITTAAGRTFERAAAILINKI